MNTYYTDYPTGREVVAEPQEYPFYAQHPTATARFLEYAEERFEYRDPSELDLTSHRKIRDLARGGYYRPYGMADITALKLRASSRTPWPTECSSCSRHRAARRSRASTSARWRARGSCG